MGTPSLADAFSATRTVKGPSCGVPLILEQLTPDERALVEDWLADGDVGHQHIANTLTKVGHRIGGGTIGRHRRGECFCGER